MAKLFGFSIEDNEPLSPSIVSPVPPNNEDGSDFYLSSVVQKGNLKIAISTNGKSPTLAKRIKEYLDEIIPDEIDDLLLNMNSIRKKLSGNFEEKVKKLNEITKSLVEKEN